MTCGVCQEHPQLADKESSLVKGTNIYRRDTLKYHHVSGKHTKCDQKNWALQNSNQGVMVEHIRVANADRQDKILKLFELAYYVAKRELPFAEFPHLIAITKKIGTSLPSQYTSDQACRRFLQYIHQELKDQQIATINAASVISVLADGSTDKSVKEQELVYVRCVDRKIGQPIQCYVSIETLDNANAPGVLQGIETGVERY